ncbi:MAG TPA: putative toxin-antitoxin system toxin component, PIN family [Burkholderiales bacterium]|nr:putative toxin-antitoxin system toxin component, PIN family [Burkholderiales bacterium]
MLRAVLDCHVYISAIIRPEGPPGHIIERFLQASAFELVLSPSIRDEVLGALNYPKVRKSIKREVDPELWFEDILLLAKLVAGEYKVTGVSEDPDDDIYLAAAIEGRCSYIVSGDPDLRSLDEHEGVRIVTPRVFATVLAS